MNKKNIPIWIYLLSGLVVFILCFKTFAALAAPQLAYGVIDGNNAANQKVLWELAGRNVAMIVAILAALKSRDARVIALLFMMHMAREGFDMFIVVQFEGLTANGLAHAGSFVPFLVAYAFALRKLLSLALTDSAGGRAEQSDR